MPRNSKRPKTCPLSFLGRIKLCRMPSPERPPIPSTMPDQLEVLDTFVESADELCSSEYVAQIRRDGLSIKREWTPSSVKVTTTNPSQEAAKAVVLTLRLFCQDNDATSLNNVATMLGMMPVDATAAACFHQSRLNFNLFLDSAPTISFPTDAGAATNRQIWDTFLYGKFAHARVAKRRVIKRWQDELYGNDVHVQFDVIVLEFIKAVSIMSKTCKEIAASIRRADC